MEPLLRAADLSRCDDDGCAHTDPVHVHAPCHRAAWLRVTLDDPGHYPSYDTLHVLCADCCAEVARVAVRIDNPIPGANLRQHGVRPVIMAVFQGDIYLIDPEHERTVAILAVAP